MTTTPAPHQPVEAIPATTLRDWFAGQALIGLIAAAGNLAASGERVSNLRRNEQVAQGNREGQDEKTPQTARE